MTKIVKKTTLINHNQYTFTYARRAKKSSKIKIKSNSTSVFNQLFGFKKNFEFLNLC